MAVNNSGRKMRIGVVCLLVAATALSACARNRKDAVSFNGFFFQSRAEKVSKEERDHFTVTVKKVSQDFDGAKEAGRHAGVSYCIAQYGTSKIDWVFGPDDEGIIPSDDEINFEGYCRP
ncbi:hypothetical protein [Shimia abyssi]|uniref:hypothetical protein n=1 Tax=Shimia abyssi TaxID=1662395 RepID=UPI001FAFEE70|nr:hypothetical protein [Shimia abyssi]